MESKNLPDIATFQQTISTPYGGTSSSRTALRIIFRQKIFITVFIVTTFSIVSFVTFVSPKVYQSDAKLFIQLGRESMSVDPSVVGPTANVRSDRESELNSEVSALKSRVLAERVVESLGANRIFGIEEGEASQGFTYRLKGYVKKLLPALRSKYPMPIEEAAANETMENLSVEVEKKSHTILLSYQAQSPQLARSILNAFIDQYRDQHIEMHQAQAPLQFIENKAESLRKILEEKEERLKDFQVQHSIVSLDAQRNEVLGQVSLLQQEVDQVGSLIGASGAKIESIRRSLEGLTPNKELNRVVGRPNRTVEAIKERLFELRSQEADLVAHYPDTDRGLLDLRAKIRLAESQLSREKETNTEITQGVDSNYQSLMLSLANEQAQLQALNARQGIIERQIIERKAVLQSLSSHETSLDNLHREVDIANNEYQRYRENLQRAKISADLDSGRYSNIKTIQPASYSSVHIKPRITLNLLFGLLFGIAGGLGLAFFREYIDNSIKGTMDVEEKIGLPVLASISRREFESCI